MALSKKEEQDIKTLLNREATETEKIIFDTMWSEHCSYKSTKRILKQLPIKGDDVVLGIGQDAGIISFTKHKGVHYGIAVAHESHNHPSQVLPIEGAATGVGGVVRDVYCMGADVIGVLDSLHFGINKEGKTPLVEEIADKVIQGVSEYGNALGVPVLGGETLYHESYNDNCLVNVAALGLIDTDHIIHSAVPKQAKDTPYVLILLGKSTDATGFGGASFSSQTLDDENADVNVGAVQVHDPFLKRVIVEASKELLKEVKKQNIPIGFKDLGAGGIACACSEIGISGGFGVKLNLDQVNTSIKNLPSEVIACSETQERYCLAVPKSFADQVLKIYNETFALPKLYPNAGAAVIGDVITESKFILHHQQKCVCDLPIAAITTDVSVHRHAQAPTKKTPSTTSDTVLETNIQKAALAVLSDQNCISKRYVYRFYDNAVRGNTIIYPGEADAVVVKPINDCDQAVAVSMDSNLYGHACPYTSGLAAVCESVRNVISVGAKPIALTDCLNYGNPEIPSAFYEFEQGVKGIADAANKLSFIPNQALPLISGNVSLYNESKNKKAVIPSPVLLCVGKLQSYKQAKTMQITDSTACLFRIGNTQAAYAGTIAAKLKLCTDQHVMQINLEQESAQNACVYNLFQNNYIHACHDISTGGSFLSLVEMLLGERGTYQVGADITFKHDLFQELFSEAGGYIIAVAKKHQKEVQNSLLKSQVAFQYLGQCNNSSQLKIQSNNNHLTLTNHQLSDIWNSKNPW